MQGLMQEWPLTVDRILDYAAKFHGEQAVVSRTPDGGTATCTYAEVNRRARLCALALRALGVRPGDRVATLAWNNTPHLEAWYGIMGLGAVCHTLNPRLFDADLRYIISHAEDCLVLADAAFAPLLARLAPDLPSVRRYVFLCDDAGMPKPGTAPPRSLCYETLLRAAAPGLPGFAWAARDEGAAAGLCYTSGTTGAPKGVLYSHRSNFLHALAICLPDALDLRSTSTMLAVVPMFHANAWGLTFGAPLVGAKLVLPGPFLDGKNIHEMLERHRVTHTAGVPTVWLGLADYQEGQRVRSSTLRVLVVGGAACPRRLVDFFEGPDGRAGVELRQLWGMTELSPAGTVGAMKGTLPRTLDREAAVALKLKQGRPHFACDMRIVDDDGRALPHDGKAFGSLQVRGPIVLGRYYKSDAAGADAEGWFDTGDVATIDPGGWMQITDRSKDVIKSGGEWISSIEIENVAVGHPGVAEAAVIAVPDPKWTERPLLVVVLRPGASLSREELLGYLEGKIAKWWIPEHVEFVEEIPHTATGKISKLTLRQRFKDWAPPVGARRSKL